MQNNFFKRAIACFNLQYGSEENGGLRHVPKGYDWWIGLKGNSRYYNYTLSINGTKRHCTDQYLTDVIVI